MPFKYVQDGIGTNCEMTIGEMIALLPIKGAVFMLPYRFLCRGVVRKPTSTDLMS